MSQSRLILPGERRPVVPAAAALPANPPPLDRLAECLMARGVQATLSVRAAGEAVQVVAACGPLVIPMGFSVEQARGIIGHLAAAIAAVEARPLPALVSRPVPDTGPDHPGIGLPFLPAEACTDTPVDPEPNEHTYHDAGLTTRCLTPTQRAARPNGWASGDENRAAQAAFRLRSDGKSKVAAAEVSAIRFGWSIDATIV